MPSFHGAQVPRSSPRLSVDDSLAEWFLDGKARPHSQTESTEFFGIGERASSTGEDDDENVVAIARRRGPRTISPEKATVVPHCSGQRSTCCLRGKSDKTYLPVDALEERQIRFTRSFSNPCLLHAELQRSVCMENTLAVCQCDLQNLRCYFRANPLEPRHERIIPLSRRLTDLSAEALECSFDRTVPGAMDIFSEAAGCIELLSELLQQGSVLEKRSREFDAMDISEHAGASVNTTNIAPETAAPLAEQLSRPLPSSDLPTLRPQQAIEMVAGPSLGETPMTTMAASSFVDGAGDVSGSVAGGDAEECNFDDFHAKHESFFWQAVGCVTADLIISDQLVGVWQTPHLL
eukprot:TRINITY_DN70181_c0_g1_i1.p1 TRINITY_DN70181_c0_g1~~TRINITY_DN70181_c0_g1_i1.p1  ORF type:complete len:349 (-),score=55.72 TRINITY_DN70181_c0_g1_i1:29-1075(-)